VLLLSSSSPSCLIKYCPTLTSSVTSGSVSTSPEASATPVCVSVRWLIVPPLSGSTTNDVLCDMITEANVSPSSTHPAHAPPLLMIGGGFEPLSLTGVPSGEQSWLASVSRSDSRTSG